MNLHKTSIPALIMLASFSFFFTVCSAANNALDYYRLRQFCHDKQKILAANNDYCQVTQSSPLTTSSLSPLEVKEYSAIVASRILTINNLQLAWQQKYLKQYFTEKGWQQYREILLQPKLKMTSPSAWHADVQENNQFVILKQETVNGHRSWTVQIPMRILKYPLQPMSLYLGKGGPIIMILTLNKVAKLDELSSLRISNLIVNFIEKKWVKP